MIGLLILALLPTMTPAVHAALPQGGDEQENLTDVREINVIVERLPDAVEEAGLERDALVEALETQLDQRGVPLGNSRSAADLYVNIATDEGSTGLFAYCVRVSLQQLVTIEGNQLRAYVDTWDLASVGTVGRGNLADVETIVRQIVDVFSDDYLDVNEPR